MSMIYAAMRALFDALLYPFREMSPLVGLTLMSVLFGVGMLVVLKYTSNQEKLDAIKRKIHASLFEIRLFNDDLRAILRAQWDILRHNVRYLGLWMVPMLVMTVPMLLMVGQLHFHYGYRGLEPGEQTLFTVELTQDRGSKPAANLELPEGLRIDAGPIWIPAERELSWRLEAEDWGDYEVVFEIDGERYEKNVQVAKNIARRSPVRPAATFVDQLLYPAEAPLPVEGAVNSISMTYPSADGGISGWDSELTWMLIFVVLSIIAAFALKGPFGVTF